MMRNLITLMEEEEEMNTDKQTLQMKVQKVIRKKPMNGPDIIELCLSVLSYHPRGKALKEHPVPYPSIRFTVNHLVHTPKGLKSADKIKIGDIILCDLPLVVK